MESKILSEGVGINFRIWGDPKVIADLEHRQKVIQWLIKLYQPDDGVKYRLLEDKDKNQPGSNIWELNYCDWQEILDSTLGKLLTSRQ